MCGKTNLYCRLAQGFDALGAQDLLDLAPVLHDGHLLQVGFESPVGGVLRERAIMPEGGRLATVCTLSHCTRSFPTMIPEVLPAFGRKYTCTFGRHGISP